MGVVSGHAGRPAGLRNSHVLLHAYKGLGFVVLQRHARLGRPLGSLNIFPYWFIGTHLHQCFQGSLKANQEEINLFVVDGDPGCVLTELLSCNCCTDCIWRFPKMRGTLLGVPIIGIIVFCGLYWVLVIWETTIYLRLMFFEQLSQAASFSKEKVPDSKSD